IRELKTTSQGVSPRSFEDHTPFLGIRQTEPSYVSSNRQQTLISGQIFSKVLIVIKS
ncbi:hypothetical protein EDD56_14511, partial [Pseudobacteriovorax antillogorgiicola]